MCAVASLRSWAPGLPASESGRLRYGDGPTDRAPAARGGARVAYALDSGSGGRDLSSGPEGKEERVAAAKGRWEFPRSAVAEFKDGTLTGWTGSPATHLVRKQLAAMLAMPEVDGRCVDVDGSGCDGRNGHDDTVADAALWARAASRPARVQWMRADEPGWDPKGPPTLIDLHGGLDGDGYPRRGQEPDRGQYRADDPILTGENS